MSTDLVTYNIGQTTEIQAADLARKHLGKLVAITTGAAVYIGELTRISHYPRKVYLAVTRDKAEASLDIDPEHIVMVAD